MGIIDSLIEAGQTFIDDLNTPESFKKGQKFEDFTRNVIFPSQRYKLLKKTHDFKQNSNDYVYESMEPDYKFECLETGRQFYVEAKYRSALYQGKIEFCKVGQFNRLYEISKQEPVFILIGLGGDPSNPMYVCLIPMCDIETRILTERFFENYDIAHNVSLPPNKLWSLVNYNTGSHYHEIKRNSTEMTRHLNNAYCIRCKDEIRKDCGHPFCKTCYIEWNKFKNADYIEKYCHICGTQNKTTFSKPICYSCYLKNN